MKIIDEKELIEILKGFKNSGLYIKIEGNISCMNSIYKFDFQLQNGILRFKDKISRNYFIINLVEVYQMKASDDRNTIKLYLDEKIIITILN